MQENAKHLLRIVTGFGFGLGLGAACYTDFDIPDHCENLLGDETCREKYQVGRVFCSEGKCEPDALDGCVEARPEQDSCYSPCGGGKTIDRNRSGLVMADVCNHTRAGIDVRSRS